MLEEGSFRGRTADFVVMFIFGGVLMIVSFLLIYKKHSTEDTWIVIAIFYVVVVIKIICNAFLFNNCVIIRNDFVEIDL